jgi:hypothetical protein
LSISYNFLNLPSQLGSLGILYDATGRKWRKAGLFRQLAVGSRQLERSDIPDERSESGKAVGVALVAAWQ